MIIYGQNRDSIINFDNIIDIYIEKDVITEDGSYLIYCDSDERVDMFLGEYKSYERAKEVLQEFVQIYTGYIFDDKNNMLYSIPKVYAMPEK